MTDLNLSSVTDATPRVDLLEGRRGLYGPRAPAAVILFNALSADAARDIIRQVGDAFPGGKDCPIECRVGGVEVDIVAALNDAWARIREDDEVELDERVKVALDHILFDDLADAIADTRSALLKRVMQELTLKDHT